MLGIMRPHSCRSSPKMSQGSHARCTWNGFPCAEGLDWDGMDYWVWRPRFPIFFGGDRAIPQPTHLFGVDGRARRMGRLCCRWRGRHGVLDVESQPRNDQPAIPAALPEPPGWLHMEIA